MELQCTLGHDMVFQTNQLYGEHQANYLILFNECLFSR